MKNIKVLLCVFAFTAIAGFTSCQQEVDAGGTAVQAMCGEWVAYSPDFHRSFRLKTSNTTNNDPKKIIVTDINTAGTGTGFWGFAVKADCDVAQKSFSCTNVMNEYWTEVNGVRRPYEIKISIRNGKITDKAIELPSGVKADKIEFEIWFEDIDDEDLPADYFCKMVGYRFSGFDEDVSFVYRE